MTPEEAAALRSPFPPDVLGKLPRVTDKTSQKTRCKDCGGYLPKHIHLDYVGHAAVTDRLLSVDPGWAWEPFAVGPDGLPAVVVQGGEASLWVRMTVCGVSRVAVGTVAAGAFELPKQLISDAIRNGAMRFGVGLDLWAKDGLERHDEEPSSPAVVTARLSVAVPEDPRVEPLRERARLLFDAGVDVMEARKAESLPAIADSLGPDLDRWAGLLDRLEDSVAPFTPGDEK